VSRHRQKKRNFALDLRYSNLPVRKILKLRELKERKDAKEIKEIRAIKECRD
jgi:hypothetical protein